MSISAHAATSSKILDESDVRALPACSAPHLGALRMGHASKRRLLDRGVLIRYALAPEPTPDPELGPEQAA